MSDCDGVGKRSEVVRAIKYRLFIRLLDLAIVRKASVKIVFPLYGGIPIWITNAIFVGN